MAYPQEYERLYDYAGYQNANPARPLPGTRVNLDLNDVQRAISEIIATLRGVTRSDGAIANGSVGLDQLSSGVLAGIEEPTQWAAATDYTTNSTVFYGTALYRANVDHTSDASFDAAKWDELVDFSTSLRMQNADSRSAIASLTVGADTNFIRTAGYATAGDGGAALYKRKVSEPSHAGKVQSADSVWFEIVPNPHLNVKQFGAIGNGSQDNYAVILAADAAAAALACPLYFPTGSYAVTQVLNITRDELTWFGDGPTASIIKLTVAATAVLWLGGTVGTTQYNRPHIHDLKFDGNGASSTAALQVRNVQNGRFVNLRISNSAGHGLATTTSVLDLLVNNFYSRIQADYNATNGFNFVGEKDTLYSDLLANNNTLAGFYFGPATSSIESTQCTCNGLLSRNNGGDGFIFDMLEKYNCGTLTSAINGGYGLQFKSSITSGGGTNNVNIASFISRNDPSGGIKVATNGYVNGAHFGNVHIIGFNSTLNTNAVDLVGVTGLHFGTLDVVGWNGTVMRIRAGTPLGGSTVQSSGISFSSIALGSNGNGAATTNHGISIEDSSANISIGTLQSANSQTTGTNYELKVGASVTNVTVGTAVLTASGGVGNNLNLANATTYIGLGNVGAMVRGTSTNDSAAAGNIGEFVESEVLVGSAVSMSTGTAKTITSISLTAGDWWVFGSVFTTMNGATTPTGLEGAINTTTDALPTPPSKGGYVRMNCTGTGQDYGLPVGGRRLSLNSTTTVYLVGKATFGASTLSLYGYIGARRVR